MIPLSCPVPSNINPLQINGFMFGINKLPDLSYFCQEVSIPEMNLGVAQMSTPFVDVPMPGDKLDFSDLQITFMVDSDMKNYKAINHWMSALGFPESRDQFADFIRQFNDGTNSTNRSTVSDATLMILNNSNNPIATVTFFDAFPVAISSVTMQSTVDNTQYLSGSCTFKYSHYKFS